MRSPRANMSCVACLSRAELSERRHVAVLRQTQTKRTRDLLHRPYIWRYTHARKRKDQR